VANLRRHGYGGTIWGVNPSLPQIESIEVFASVADLPTPPDLVVAAVPARAAVDVVAGSADAGAVVVFAAGFGESGQSGLETSLREAAESAGVRVIGPNSGGIIRPGRGLAASFLTCLDRPAAEVRSGPVAVISQSGGIASYLNNLASGRGEGIGATVSTGNEADLGLGEALDAVSRLDEVSVVIVVLETVRDGPSLFDAIRSCQSMGKTVVACRLGSGESSGRLLASHTGAMALPEKILSGVLTALGVPVAATPAEAYEVATILARSAPAAGRRVGVVTHSGGFAILLSDLAEQADLELPQPSAALAEAVVASLDHGSATNPLDLGAIIGGPERFAMAVAQFNDSSEYDVVLAVTTAHPPAHTAARVSSLMELDSPVPVVHLWMAGDQGETGLRQLRAAHVPITDEPRAAVAALHALTIAGFGSPAPQPLVGRPETWGVPSLLGGLATTSDEAVELATRMGYPVVVKAEADGLLHKTELGLVRLGMRNDDAVTQAFMDVTNAAVAAGWAFPEIRVQPFRPGLEIIVGAVAHESLGPLVSVGLGGVMAEIMSDVVFAPGPIDVAAAGHLIERLAGRRVLDGYRGGPAADVGRLAEIVSLMSRGIAGGTVAEFEINPLAWDGEEWVALDWLVLS
jgi:acetate---CoA ligase (ADP-forming)